MTNLSSTNKTENLNLNNWIGSDVPQRVDFNMDNSIIDSVLGGHIDDEDVHVSTDDRSKWNAPYYMGTYIGNDASSRTIDVPCSFNPRWGIVFAAGIFPQLNDYGNQGDYNYFGIVSTNGSTIGVSLSGKQLSVIQSATAVSNYEYRNYNEGGTTYVYILFR